VEQPSHTVWQQQMGRKMTPGVPNWLTATICDYHCQLSLSSSGWMTKWDCCEVRAPSAVTLLYITNHLQISEYRCANRRAYNEGF
jgi:hypothetical protein